MNLYWCWTSDHSEDWFIVAKSARYARRFHEDAEGYGKGEASCERIARVPADTPEGWPENKLVQEYVGPFVQFDPVRIVKFGKRIFREGMVEPLREREH
jgi:hypothetical protein